MGMSISRYRQPIGTAGFDRMCVSGNSLVPRPPPNTIVSTSFMAPQMLQELYTPRRPPGGFTTPQSPGGGEVREEQDSALVRSTHYTDWHRVERAMLAFELETR